MFGTRKAWDAAAVYIRIGAIVWVATPIGGIMAGGDAGIFGISSFLLFGVEGIRKAPFGFLFLVWRRVVVWGHIISSVVQWRNCRGFPSGVTCRWIKAIATWGLRAYRSSFDEFFAWRCGVPHDEELLVKCKFSIVEDMEFSVSGTQP
jgi:hypothetical protein